MHLSADAQAKVDAKLADLQQKTGRLWTCEITKPPSSSDPARYLEIAADGQIFKPIVFNGDEACSAEHICRELDRAFNQKL